MHSVRAEISLWLFHVSIVLIRSLHSPVDISSAFGGDIINSLSFGYEHSGFLTSSGKVFMCGLNDKGQLGTGDTSTQATPQELQGNLNPTTGRVRIIKISAAYKHTGLLSGTMSGVCCSIKMPQFDMVLF